jgi:hypothetical protein
MGSHFYRQQAPLCPRPTPNSFNPHGSIFRYNLESYVLGWYSCAHYPRHLVSLTSLPQALPQVNAALRHRLPQRHGTAAVVRIGNSGSG